MIGMAGHCAQDSQHSGQKEQHVSGTDRSRDQPQSVRYFGRSDCGCL
jgi:hypothetical protein